MVKSMCLAFVLFFAACLFIPAYAQQPVTSNATIEMAVEIVSVDTKAGTIVVKQFNDAEPIAGEGQKNITLIVSPETKITEGEIPLKLVQLAAKERRYILVLLKNAPNNKNAYKALSIKVKELEVKKK